MLSLRIHPPTLTVAAEKGCATHDVSLAAAVRTLFLLLRIEAVIDAVVTRLLLHRIHPTTPIAVPALLFLWLFGHLYIGCGIGENGLPYYLTNFFTYIHI